MNTDQGIVIGVENVGSNPTWPSKYLSGDESSNLSGVTKRKPFLYGFFYAITYLLDMIIIEGKLEDLSKKYIPKFNRDSFTEGLTP